MSRNGRNSPRVLVLGMDSGDRNLLLHWSREGLLPTIGSLLDTGLVGSTQVPVGLGNDAMWTTLYTGAGPGTHGCFFPYQMQRGTYRSVRHRSIGIRPQPFWNTLSRAGKRVAVFDVPLAPLSETINGVQLVDWMTHGGNYGRPLSHPEAFASEVTGRFGTDPVEPCDAVVRDARGYRELRDRMLQRIDRKEAAVTDCLLGDDWNLFFTVFADPHCVGHNCWHFHDATHPEHEAPADDANDLMLDIYATVDAAIGRILERVDPDTTVVFFAGPGMGPNYTASLLLDTVLERLEGSSSGESEEESNFESLKSLYRRLLPATVQSALRPLADGIDQSVLAKGRRNRRAFVVPHADINGAIRINLVGREPNGLVRAGAEYDEFCERLTRELYAIVNDETGGPVVRNIRRMREFHPGPFCEDVDDLVVEWNREAPIRSMSSPGIGTLRAGQPVARTGDHRPDCLFVIRGTGIRQGEIDHPFAVTDIAPTLCFLLGVSTDDMEGTPIELGGQAAGSPGTR